MAGSRAAGPSRHVVVARQREQHRCRKPLDEARRSIELSVPCALGDVSRQHGDVRLLLMREIDQRIDGLGPLAAEMRIGKMQDHRHGGHTT
jgi:hypothetical protein